MSRLPPNYSNSSGRSRSGSTRQDGIPSISPPIRPLQINRTPTSTRPTSPSSNFSSSPSGKGPARPMRSGLRDRQLSDISTSDRASLDSRTAPEPRGSGDRFDYGRGESSITRNGSVSTSSRSYGSSQTVTSPTSPLSPDSGITPSSMAAIVAFQALGKKRGMTNDSIADAEYEREKAQEREAERARQQRLRDRAPGRKPTGKTKAGDIDGELLLWPVCPWAMNMDCANLNIVI